MSKTPTEISYIFSAHLEEVYGRLTTDLREVWLPEKERLEKALREASYKTFSTEDEYDTHPRAREYSWRISHRMGADVFRVYFNEFSKKVYVDLNSTKTRTYFEGAAGVIELGSEIARSIMFTDPDLLGEVEPTEIVIPPTTK